MRLSLVISCALAVHSVRADSERVEEVDVSGYSTREKTIYSLFGSDVNGEGATSASAQLQTLEQRMARLSRLSASSRILRNASVLQGGPGGDTEHCQYGQWGDFSDCSRSCGTGGQKFRFRGVKWASEEGVAQGCFDTVDVEQCVDLPKCWEGCEVDEYGEPGSWSDCNVPCGKGVQHRFWKGKPDGCDALGETRTCVRDPCPAAPEGVNLECRYESEPVVLTECSKSCDGERMVELPLRNLPLGSGTPCDGKRMLQRQLCSHEGGCPKDGNGLEHVTPDTECEFDGGSDPSECFPETCDIPSPKGARTVMRRVLQRGRNENCAEAGSVFKLEQCTLKPEYKCDDACEYHDPVEGQCTVPCGGGVQLSLLAAKNHSAGCKDVITIKLCIENCPDSDRSVIGYGKEQQDCTIENAEGQWTKCSDPCGGTQLLTRVVSTVGYGPRSRPCWHGLNDLYDTRTCGGPDTPECIAFHDANRPPPPPPPPKKKGGWSAQHYALVIGLVVLFISGLGIVGMLIYGLCCPAHPDVRYVVGCW